MIDVYRRDLQMNDEQKGQLTEDEEKEEALRYIEETTNSASGSGGPAALIRKTVTANGDYTAADEGADGYSGVTVNVPSAGYTVDDIAGGAVAGDITLTGENIMQGAFTYNPRITSVTVMGAAAIGNYAFYYCTGITRFFAPAAVQTGQNALEGCSAMTHAVLGNLNGARYAVKGCTNLTALDVGGGGKLASSACYGCTRLETIVLRSATLVALDQTSVFTNSPFKNGGTGGTIYIPRALYDHLGDGSSSDYKVATNWSTVDGWGTVTWASIEGSVYETQYVDGTPIPTA